LINFGLRNEFAYWATTFATEIKSLTLKIPENFNTPTTTPALYLGQNLTAIPADQLAPVSLEQLYGLITDTEHSLARKVMALRQLRSLNPEAYSKRKRELPYFAGSTFRPLTRHKNNFVKADWFVLDLDHLSHHEVNLPQLKQRLWDADKRIALLFTSPSDDGLKLVFRLQMACHEPQTFSTFYKLFLAEFAAQHGLQSLADAVTHDVSRVCFLSHDPDACMRADAETIPLDKYLDNSQRADLLFDQLSANNRTQSHRIAPKAPPTGVTDLVAHPTEPRTMVPAPPQLPEVAPTLDPDQLKAVIQTLNPRPPMPDQMPPFVPTALDEPCQEVVTIMEQLGLTISEVRDIQYGRKLVLTQGRNFAELNIFYGKRGFSVVVSPKAGSNVALAEQLKEVTLAVIFRSPAPVGQSLL
jgi:hypothetical protein